MTGVRAGHPRGTYLGGTLGRRTVFAVMYVAA
jgi:hypothetical protein